MNNCETCRWWGDEDIDLWHRDDQEPYPDEYEQACIRSPEHRECSCPKIIYRYGDRGDGRYPIIEEGGAVYNDYEGYSATFATTATFGCVYWELDTRDGPDGFVYSSLEGIWIESDDLFRKRIIESKALEIRLFRTTRKP